MYTSEIIKPLENKMLKKILAIAMLSMSGHATCAADVPTFTDADWAGVPVPGTLSVDEVMRLFVGPVQKNGREWTLYSFNNDDLRAVTADRQFEARQLVDANLFAHQQFEVDSTGRLKIELFLVSMAKNFPRQVGDKEYFRPSRLPITTQLTAEELKNPIVIAVKSSSTFEEESRLARADIAKYQRALGVRNARQLLIFVRPDRADEVRAELEDMMADLEADEEIEEEAEEEADEFEQN
jgi:hypothetical protein